MDATVGYQRVKTGIHCKKMKNFLRTFRFTFFSLLIFQAIVSGKTFPAQDSTLTLQECVGIALQNSPEYQRLENSRPISRLKYASALANSYPQVALSLNAPFTLNKSEQEVYFASLNRYELISRTDRNLNPAMSLDIRQTLPTDGTVALRLGSRSNRYYSSLSDDRNRLINMGSLEFSQSLFGLNSYRLNRQQADLDRQSARVSYLQNRNDLIYSVIEAYYELLLAESRQKINAKSLEENRLAYQLVKQKVEMGRAAELDLMNAEIEQQNQQLEILNQQEKLSVRQIRFNQLLGLPPDFILRTDTTISMETWNDDLEQTTVKILANHPVIEQSALQLRSQRLSLKEIRQQNRMRFDFSTALDYDNQIEYLPRSQNSQFYNWSVALRVQVPLWDGGRASKNIEAAKLNLQNLEMQSEQNRRDLTLEIRTLYQSLERQKESYGILKEKVRYSEKALALSRLQYEAGRIPLSELFRAQAVLKSARLDLVSALIEHNKNVYQLRKMMGSELLP